MFFVLSNSKKKIFINVKKDGKWIGENNAAARKSGVNQRVWTYMTKHFVFALPSCCSE